MNKQELREKIIKVLTERFGIMPIDNVTDPALYFFERVADELIAVGIGDVSELKKHRAQIMKDGTTQQLYNGEEVEQIVKEREEYKHRSEFAERAVSRVMCYCECLSSLCPVYDEIDCPYIGRASTDNCTKMHLLLAEKELQEERKDV